MSDTPKTKHAPAPWEYRKVDGRGELLDAGGEVILEIYGNSPEEADANGELIAAAPELLAALEKIAEAPEGAWNNDMEIYYKNVIEWCMETARAAIAATKGPAT